MDYKKIRDYISKYYVREGEVYTLKPKELVEDENIRIEAMISQYLYEEARRHFKENKATEVKFDEILERLITVYGIDGSKMETPENKLVWSIINSDGHVEEEFIDESTTGNKYQILTGPNKNLGLAVLRYLARKEGFDIQNLDISVDSSNFKEKGTSKITIDFTKGPVLDKIDRPKAEFQSTAGRDTEKIEAQKQLELAQQKGDANLIKYWEDILAGKTPAPYQPADHKKEGIFASLLNKLTKNKNNVTKVQEDMTPTPDTSFIDAQIEEAKRNNNPDMVAYWEDMKKTVQSAQQNPKVKPVSPPQPAPAPQQSSVQPPVQPATIQGPQPQSIPTAPNAAPQQPTPAPEPPQPPAQDGTQEDPKIAYAKAQLEEAIRLGDDPGIEHWKNMIRLEDPQVKKTLAYARERLALAQSSHDSKSEGYWNNIIESIIKGKNVLPEHKEDGPSVKM